MLDIYTGQAPISTQLRSQHLAAIPRIPIGQVIPDCTELRRLDRRRQQDTENRRDGLLLPGGLDRSMCEDRIFSLRGNVKLQNQGYPDEAKSRRSPITRRPTGGPPRALPHVSSRARRSDNLSLVLQNYVLYTIQSLSNAPLHVHWHYQSSSVSM